MRIKTILFAFGALLIFGMVMLAVDTWAEVPVLFGQFGGRYAEKSFC